MELTLSGSLLADDLGAVPGFVVVTLSLLTEHVANVVSIVLLEFVSINTFLGEFLLPEHDGLVDCEPNSLKEQP